MHCLLTVGPFVITSSFLFSLRSRETLLQFPELLPPAGKRPPPEVRPADFVDVVPLGPVPFIFPRYGSVTPIENIRVQSLVPGPSALVFEDSADLPHSGPAFPLKD